MSTGARRPSRCSVALALLAIGLAALAARAIGYERVFVDADTVVFAFGDSYYEARMARYSFAHFPRFLTFDPCLNHPHGAVSQYPPLHPLVVAGLARLAGGGEARFERVAAWAPALFGALGVLPVFALGRRISGAGVGLGAAALYAGLPIAIIYSRVGNADHHAFVALLGAVLLLLYAQALDARTQGARLTAVFAALVAVRAALVTSWNGSLLYPPLGELALVAAGAALGRQDLLRGQLWSGLATAALVAPAVWLLPTPPGGDWSATELSRLHPLAFACAALVAGGTLLWETLRPSRSGVGSLGRAAAVALGLAVLLAALPDAREGFQRALDFLGREDEWASRVAENFPLFFAQGRMLGAAGEGRMGGFAYLIPAVPFAFLSLRHGPGGRAQALFLAAWGALFGYLALQQVRYANDFAAVGCTGFAVLLARLAQRLERGASARTARLAAVATGAVLWGLSLRTFFVPWSQPTLAALRGTLAANDRALLSVEGTQLRFAQMLERATPPALHCDAPTDRPAGGVLAHPSLGHTLHYVAWRATPIDPFGPYLDRETFRSAMPFLETESEDELVAIAERLRTPFVVTAEEGWDGPPRRVVQRLHRRDGSAVGDLPHVGRLRLLAELSGGIPQSAVFAPPVEGVPDYKLYALVAGALLLVPAAPGIEVDAQLPLATAAGRRFVFSARAVAGADGLARLRLPYPSDARGEVRALQPWRVSTPQSVYSVSVPEEAVASGATIRLDEPAPG